MPSDRSPKSTDPRSSSILIPEANSDHLSLEPLPVTKILFLSLLKKYPKSSGYDLMHKVSDLFHNRLTIQSGSIYPALRELEQQELVFSEMVTPSRRKRRVYTLTPTGEEELSLLSGIIRKRMDFLMHPLLKLIETSGDP